MMVRSKVPLIPNAKQLIETERTQNKRERAVTSPHRSRAVLCQGHQQLQSIQRDWVWSYQNVLVPEREGGEQGAAVEK